MISPEHARLMARYNRWQNRSIYAAAGSLEPDPVVPLTFRDYAGGDDGRRVGIAADLGTSEKTVKVHRGRLMEKMRAGSLADAYDRANMADRLAAFGGRGNHDSFLVDIQTAEIG